MPAILNTAEVRLALIGWKTELLNLGSEFPGIFGVTDLTRRIDALDAALLAIDSSTTVILMPDA